MTLPDDFTCPAFADAHVHLREPADFEHTVPATARYADWCLAMPNTSPPLDCNVRRLQYEEEAESWVRPRGPKIFSVLAAVKLLPTTTPADLTGAKVAKLYPGGVTTSSIDGWSKEHLKNLGVVGFDHHPDDGGLGDLLLVMEEERIVLSVHAELPGSECLRRENDFIPVLRMIRRMAPTLRIVVEHVTTEEMVWWVAKQDSEKVMATITLHHLETTLDDVIGDKLRPHLFCKPIPKLKDDRSALRYVVLDGDPHFFLGSDSAPHRVEKKECDHGCAGVFTAPYLPEHLLEFFMTHGRLENMADFVSERARMFYGLSPAKFRLRFRSTLAGTVYTAHVPERVGPYKPYRAGEPLKYAAEVV